MKDMITIGDIKLDTFVVLDGAKHSCQLRMPECQICLDYGAKISVDIVASQVAGSAPNVAVGLSRLGKQTSVISNMGNDLTLDLAIKKLKEENVGTEYIRVIRGEKSAYSVVLNFKGEKTILTSHIHKSYRLPKPIKRTKWIYVSEMGSGYESLYRSVTAYAKKNKVNIGFNPGSIQIKEKKQALYKLIKHTSALFVNMEEAQVISGESTLEVHHLARALWKLGAKTVVITDGKNGSYSFNGSEIIYCPIFPGKLVEATGAGDSFATGYIGATLHEKDHKTALVWGAVNSSSVVGKVGPQDGLLTKRQILTRLKKRPSFKISEL